MKKLIEVSKEDSGMLSLIGEQVTIIACRYIYTGKLVGVNDTCVELQGTKIVYETGAWDKKDYSNAESLPGDSLFIATGSIESFGILK